VTGQLGDEVRRRTEAEAAVARLGKELSRLESELVSLAPHEPARPATGIAGVGSRRVTRDPRPMGPPAPLQCASRARVARQPEQPNSERW